MSELDMTDHDLLISLSEKMEAIKDGMDQIAPVIKSLDARMQHIEQVNARHSERLVSLRGDVEALKLDKLNKAEIETLRQDVDDLQRKSDTWNFVNSVGIGIATILGMFFRK